MRVTVEGADEAAAALAAAARALDDQDQLKAGQAVLSAVTPSVPRRTGHLAASGVVQDNVVTWTAPYAAPVHARRPWTRTTATQATQAAQAATEAWVTTITDRI